MLKQTTLLSLSKLIIIATLCSIVPPMAAAGTGLQVEDMGGQTMDQSKAPSIPSHSAGTQMSPEETQKLMQQLEELKKKMEEQNKALKQLENEM